jgi:hypothetical protein
MRKNGSVAFDDDDVVDGYLARSRAIQTDHAALPLSFDDVSLETLAVVDIDNLNALALDEVCGIHEVFIYGDAPNIIEVGLGNAYPMNFRFEDVDVHNL